MKNVLDEYIENYRIQCLFRAVLKRAANDAFLMKVSSKKREKIYHDAQAFFKNDADFKTVCRLAGVECREILDVIEDKKLKNNQKYKKIILCILGKG